MFTLFQKSRQKKIERILDIALGISMDNKQWHQIKFCEQNEWMKQKRKNTAQASIIFNNKHSIIILGQ